MATIFFYGHKKSRTVYNERVFSQFYEKIGKNNEPEVLFKDSEDTPYYCAEQYMMAGKARLFKDNETLKLILMNKDPAKIKSLGRKVKNFNEQQWKDNREKIVEQGNFYKFSQNNDLKEILLKTGKKELVEASKYDAIWGIGMFYNDPNIKDKSKWGLNLLGNCLMKVRSKLN